MYDGAQLLSTFNKDGAHGKMTSKGSGTKKNPEGIDEIQTHQNPIQQTKKTNS
jgi:hypothetical protein